uniref:Uncharacterized protein n=1 Tax=Esox lucius TaxID=8010 RepID=A0AAY5K9F6_ESOLU
NPLLSSVPRHVRGDLRFHSLPCLKTQLCKLWLIAINYHDVGESKHFTLEDRDPHSLERGLKANGIPSSYPVQPVETRQIVSNTFDCYVIIH